VRPALELRAIEKRFGPVHALRGADFTLAPGEVHALLGENGAGKSTLMHIAAGLLGPDAGTITVHGSTSALGSPRDARRAGIGLVHQHFTAIPALTVAENVALAAGWPVSRPAELRARVRTLAARTGLPLDPDARTGELPVGARQRLEILFAERMTAGRGYVAIAIVVLGRWHPVGVAVAALVFGAATALQFAFHSLGLDVPYQLFLMLPYLLALLALAGAVGRTRAPADLGRDQA
jgi:predicted ABC-type transport system involved in lysophospholipase L1 biosynthesis ATPase subunit